MDNFLKYLNPPDLDYMVSMVSEKDFTQVGFREYVCSVGDYIICVYSFATKLYGLGFDEIQYHPYELPGFLRDDIEFREKYKYKLIFNYHHQDFNNGITKIDPCATFERISGIKIHHGESDKHLMSLDHRVSVSRFKSNISSVRREDRILKILGG